MTLKGRQVTGQVNFNSHTDSVVRMAVALVNLLTPGEDRSRKYRPPEGAERAAALNALFKSAGSRTEVGSAEAEAFVPVAAALGAVFSAVAAGDVDRAAHQLNDLLAATGAHPALDRHDGEPWHIHFHSADETLARHGLGGRLRHGTRHRPRRRVARPARRVHRAALRPGLRRRIPQREQAVLLDRLPACSPGPAVALP